MKLPKVFLWWSDVPYNLLPTISKSVFQKNVYLTLKIRYYEKNSIFNTEPFNGGPQRAGAGKS